MPPRSASRAFILESATPASISLLSLSIISTGVFLGGRTVDSVTPQMGYSFLFDAKQLRPKNSPFGRRSTLLYAALPPPLIPFIDLMPPVGGQHLFRCPLQIFGPVGGGDCMIFALSLLREPRSRPAGLPATLRVWGYPRASILSCVLVAKSLASCRSRNPIVISYKSS